MSKYMSQIPPKPKPTDGPAKRNPKAVAPKPAKRNPNAGPRVMIKPYKGPKIDKDLRDKREMPKRKPKAKPVGPNLGIMGPEPKKKEAVKQKMLDDMRKRGMLKKAKKSN